MFNEAASLLLNMFVLIGAIELVMLLKKNLIKPKPPVYGSNPTNLDNMAMLRFMIQSLSTTKFLHVRGAEVGVLMTALHDLGEIERHHVEGGASSKT